ncbi:MAG: hypothetical protein ACI92S_005581, partial [Planctomycetaceae bacterium]
AKRNMKVSTELGRADYARASEEIGSRTSVTAAEVRFQARLVM